EVGAERELQPVDLQCPRGSVNRQAPAREVDTAGELAAQADGRPSLDVQQVGTGVVLDGQPLGGQRQAVQVDLAGDADVQVGEAAADNLEAGVGGGAQVGLEVLQAAPRGDAQAPVDINHFRLRRGGRRVDDCEARGVDVQPQQREVGRHRRVEPRQ